MEAQDKPQIETLMLTTPQNTEKGHAQEFHHDFEDSEANNPTRLTAITRELDDLHQ